LDTRLLFLETKWELARSRSTAPLVTFVVDPINSLLTKVRALYKDYFALLMHNVDQSTSFH